MLRRIAWTLPLLLGALLCAAGCTFPKSFGFARKQPLQPETQVAEGRSATITDDAETERTGFSLAHSLRKSTSWLAFGRQQPTETSAKQPLVDHADARTAASEPMIYPNVVPPKYQRMDAALSNSTLAKDTSGTPSLVRPSRRPPPDPAPKPPLDESPEASLATTQTRAEGPLYDLIAAASQSWRVSPQTASPQTTAAPASTAAVAASSTPAATSTSAPSTPAVASAPVAPAPAPPTEPATPADETATPESEQTRQLATETNLKFTTPELAARDRQTVTKSTDIVTNILRPARPAPRGGDTPGTEQGVLAQSAETRDRQLSATNWIAKRPVPAPDASVPANPQPSPEANAATPDAGASTVVASTFGSSGSAAQSGQPTAVPDAKPATETSVAESAKPSAASAVAQTVQPPAETASREVETAVVHSPPAPPAPQAAGAAVPAPTPAPKRTDVVARSEAARSEIARQEALAAQRHAYLTRSPSQAQMSLTTRAAAPPTEVGQEPLAPLIDADVYRARFATARNARPVPLQTAARQPTQATNGSWLAAYQRLIQENSSRPSPRPPAGSPTRSLSSDSENAPVMLQPEAPTLRR